MIAQVKRDVYVIKNNTYFKDNFIILSHSRLSFNNSITTFNIYKNNKLKYQVPITTVIDNDGNLIVNIDQTIINYPVDNYDWNLYIEFENGEKYSWIGGTYIVLSDIPNNYFKTNIGYLTESINSYEIIENNETINIEIKDTIIEEPLKTGSGYARYWDGTKFDWIITNTDIIALTNITSDTLSITKIDDIINIELTVDNINNILGYIPSNFDGSYTNLTDIPDSFNPIEHNHDISTVNNLQTTLNLKANISELLDHIADTNNPHLVLKNQLGSFEHYVLISNVINGTYPIFPTIPHSITIHYIIIRTVSGSCTATLKINSNNIINLASLTVNTNLLTISALGSNISEINDTINLEIVNNNNAVNLSIVLVYSIN